MSNFNLSAGTGSFSGHETLQSALNTLKHAGINAINTAELYGTNEADLGAVSAANQGFIMSTMNPGGFMPSSLATLHERTLASLKRLGLSQVDILYIHAPDTTIPISEWAPTIDTLYRADKFRRFGLSNFTPAQVREVHAYCAQHSFVLPSVYQGNYNAVSRLIETSLFPLLRELGMAFYAYSPIAGGFLTKKRKELEEGTAEGRFAVDNPTNPMSKMYRKLYLKPAMLEGLDKWEELAQTQGCSQAELAYRWLYYHSALEPGKGDTMILGANRAEHFMEAVDGLKRGPLKKTVVQGVDELWAVVKDESFTDNFEALVGKSI